jgi:hypothetical protein
METVKRLRSLHNPNPLNNDEPAFPVNPMHIVLNVAIQKSLDISSVIPNAWHFERPDYDAGYFPQQMEVLWVKHHYLAPFMIALQLQIKTRSILVPEKIAI